MLRPALSTDPHPVLAFEHAPDPDALAFAPQPLTLDEYRRIVGRLAALVVPLERAIGAALPASWLPLFDARRRAARLQRDLLSLGPAELPAAREPSLPALPRVAGHVEALGAMVALERTTLDGAALAAQLERTLGLRNGIGYSYFLGYGARTPAMWTELRAAGERAIGAGEAARFLAAARGTRRAFAAALRGSEPAD